MKKFAFACAFSLVVALSACSSGPSCKKTSCGTACDTTKQFCDTTAFTCVDFKTCSPACKTDGTEYCDVTTGTCVKTCSPACKTDGTEICKAGTCTAVTTKLCSPTCTGTQYCDTTVGTCKDVLVCSPVCDSAKGEVCQ